MNKIILGYTAVGFMRVGGWLVQAGTYFLAKYAQIK